MELGAELGRRGSEGAHLGKAGIFFLIFFFNFGLGAPGGLPFGVNLDEE